MGRGDRVIRGWMIGVGALHVLFVGVLTAGLLSGAAATRQAPNWRIRAGDAGFNID